MKEEEINAQITFWERLNQVVKCIGHNEASFYVIMTHEAHAGLRVGMLEMWMMLLRV